MPEPPTVDPPGRRTTSTRASRPPTLFHPLISTSSGHHTADLHSSHLQPPPSLGSRQPCPSHILPPPPSTATTTGVDLHRRSISNSTVGPPPPPPPDPLHPNPNSTTPQPPSPNPSATWPGPSPKPHGLLLHRRHLLQILTTSTPKSHHHRLHLLLCRRLQSPVTATPQHPPSKQPLLLPIPPPTPPQSPSPRRPPRPPDLTIALPLHPPHNQYLPETSIGYQTPLHHQQPPLYFSHCLRPQPGAPSPSIPNPPPSRRAAALFQQPLTVAPPAGALLNLCRPTTPSP